MPHDEVSKNQALKALDDSPVRVHQTWRHNATKNTYTIVAVGLVEATLEPVVHYAGHDGIVWTRTLIMFVGKKDGEPRFSRIEEDHETSPFWRPTDGFEPAEAQQ